MYLNSSLIMLVQIYHNKEFLFEIGTVLSCFSLQKETVGAYSNWQNFKDRTTDSTNSVYEAMIA